MDPITVAGGLEELNPRRRADGLRRLGAVGLVEEGEGWLRLHRLLVHFVRQEGLDPTAQSAVAQAFIRCGKDAVRGHLTGPALAAVIPHLVDAAEVASEGTCNERTAAELCSAAGHALHVANDLRAARPWKERAVAIREQVLGPDHPDTATSLNHLAVLLWEQGEPAAARALNERALAIRERVQGPDHPNTAFALNYLGVLLGDQGELAAAQALLERALNIRERVVGPDHRYTAISLNSLGWLLRARGELEAARLLLERSVTIRERVLGPEHHDTAKSLNYLALLLRDQGELESARALFERALATNERVLGTDHPYTVTTRANVAKLAR